MVYTLDKSILECAGVQQNHLIVTLTLGYYCSALTTPVDLVSAQIGEYLEYQGRPVGRVANRRLQTAWMSWVRYCNIFILNFQLIWNNMYPWFMGVPWSWAGILVIISVINYAQKTISVRRMFQIGGTRDILGVSTYFS